MNRETSIRIALIAALERELHPLARGWNVTELVDQGRSYRVYRCNDVLAVAGGIGAGAAGKLARAIVAKYRPQTLVSVGVAGALIRSLKVANVVTPNVIIDAATGHEYRCEAGGGILVSAAQISGSTAARQALVEKFHALAVDMEAAAVAEVARAEQVGFRCVKAISDEAGFSMPNLGSFVDEQGRFATGKFVAWAIWRPWVWPKVIALARNTGKAVRALCLWLEKNLASGLQAARIVKIEGTEFLETF